MSAYNKLLSVERCTPTSKTDRSREFEVFSDKGRIITSTAFRRLQTKAQVFSLEKNAAVRSRLTHTLEVALYGQLIAEKIFDKIKEIYIEHDDRTIFVTSIENACLLHDIGNPPFGHLGEFAIRDWFIKNSEYIRKIWRASNISYKNIEKYINSFIYFDGNPQGFRIVTKLLLLKKKYGLNLTYTLLASIMKYLDSKPNESLGGFGKKVGFFETEREIITKVWHELGLITKNGIFKRHPFVFIMEAADDIAYSSSDIEDAIEKRIISPNSFFIDIKKYIEKELKSVESKLREEERDFITNLIDNYENKQDIEDFIEFKIEVANLLVDSSANSYFENHQLIMDGDFQESLLDKDNCSYILSRSLKKYARSKIYISHEAINIELSGFRIIQEILNRFMSLIQLTKEQFKKCRNGDLEYGEFSLERRLCVLLPRKHLKAYDFACEDDISKEIIYRTHLIVDYLSGMTDSHALKIFNMIMGYSGENTYE